MDQKVSFWLKEGRVERRAPKGGRPEEVMAGWVRGSTFGREGTGVREAPSTREGWRGGGEAREGVNIRFFGERGGVWRW